MSTVIAAVAVIENKLRMWRDTYDPIICYMTQPFATRLVLSIQFSKVIAAVVVIEEWHTWCDTDDSDIYDMTQPFATRLLLSSEYSGYIRDSWVMR